MVNSGLQVVGFSLGLLGFILCTVTTFLPAWQKSNIRGEIIESVQRYAGLWTRCQAQATGIYSCDDYDSPILGLPPALQAARACAVSAIALGLIATILSAVGLNCANVASDNIKLKARIVLIAGLLHFLGGAVIGGAVSWYAANLTQEFYNLAVPETLKNVYGEALFVGWASMVLSIVAGLVLCCSSWNTDDDESPGYSYNPPKPRNTGSEYI